ncbi:MAG: rRNA maturation RNase YbeY [Deltaproteobacteria bacterium]|nr:rRNA maturation RNase YbeY [Deltaproteobacteria bacterium]
MSLQISQMHRFHDAALQRRLRTLLGRIEKASGLLSQHQIELTFIDDDEMAELNGTWRGKNQTTDVLSFAAFDGEVMPGMEDEVGDILISTERAQIQAKECGHSVEVEIAVLVVHGMLHLLGFDHEHDVEEARFMAECELSWLDAAGVAPQSALIGRSY